MNEDEERSHGGRLARSRAHQKCPVRTRRAALLVAALAGVTFGVAACGGGPSAGVAKPGATTTTTETSLSPLAGGGGGSDSKYLAALAYADCMRSHGVSSFPDPTSEGQINVNFASGGKDGAPASSGIDRMSPKYISADQTCRHLLPGGVTTPAQ